MKTKVLWFTGLSGSGKSTIAEIVMLHLKKIGKSYEVLDGDEVRKRLHAHLGFSPEDIMENNRLIVELCKKSLGKVDYILVPIISPFRISRERARIELGESFVEIYVECPYEECEKRDVKGHYKKAKSGELKNFIGLHVPYEPPTDAEIIVHSYKERPEESAKRILSYLKVI